MQFTDLILKYEITIRLSFFFGILGLIMSWEFLAPRRKLSLSRWIRWPNNLGLVLLNSLVLRLLFPAAAVGAAVLAGSKGWGIVSYWNIPFWPALIGSVVIMDFVIYIQHVMVHAVPALWRLHRVHHADLDYDVTTGARFHPIEIVLSMLIKFALIFLLGAPVAAVILFEVILNGLAMFNHGNIRLPLFIDKVLRFFIVTPDMHRVHHSTEEDEANSNFGFNLSLWDRLFGTYRNQPRAGHDDMTIGIHDFRDTATTSLLPGILMLPFRGATGAYAINRRIWNKGKNEE